MAFGYEEELKAEIARLRDALDEQTGRAAWNYECLTKCEETVIQRDAEIARLREAIRRLAEQDATLSVVGGNVIVQMDATLTDAEREAVEATIVDLDGGANFNEQRFWPMLAKRLRERSATLRGLLERLGGTND